MLECPVDFQVELEVTSGHRESSQVEPTTQYTVSTQTPHTFRLFILEDMLSDDKSVLFYTRLEDISKFNLALSTLMPLANHLHYRSSQVINVSIEDVSVDANQTEKE